MLGTVLVRAVWHNGTARLHSNYTHLFFNIETPIHSNRGFKVLGFELDFATWIISHVTLQVPKAGAPIPRATTPLHAPQLHTWVAL